MFLPLLEREDFCGFPGRFIFCRKFSSEHKNRPEVTPHADVTSYKPKPKHDGTDPVPPRRGARNEDPGTPTIWAIF
jgi:hypothetical protein